MVSPPRHFPASAARLAVLAAVWCLTSCVRLPEPSAETVRATTGKRPPAPLYPDQKPYRSTDQARVTVWMVADNLHTGMVFPYDWLLESGFVPPKGFGNPPYVNLSWGDRTAYIQHEWLNPWQVFRALFTPTPSVMEIIPIDGYVAEICQQQRIWRKLVPRENGQRLAAFLNHVSKTDESGRPVVVGPSSWGDGVLLESNCSYYLPRICNVWTAQTLEACGCTVHPLTGLTADALIRQAEAPENGFECVWRGDGTKQQPPNETPVPD